MSDDIPLINDRPFRAIFLVGSTGVGRRTAARIIAQHTSIGPIVLDAFHFELRERCHAAFKLFDEQRLPAPATCFDGQLDQPLDLFAGKTPRNAYLRFQRFVIDTMGAGALGEWVVQRLTYYRRLQEKRKVPPDSRVRSVMLVDDAPTASYQVIVDALGAQNCTQLVIRRDGTVSLPVELPGVRTEVVRNPGDSEAAFESAIRKAAPHLFIEIARVTESL